MPASDVLREHWPAVTIAVTALAIAVAAAVMLSNMPPRRIVMATGPAGGTYDEFGRRYRDVLAREGVEVKLVPTPGSVENLAMLRDPRAGIDFALVLGGVAGADDSAGVASLGTMFYEPLWWLRRREIQAVGVDGLRGRRISIGPEGSGTRKLGLELIRLSGISQQVELLDLGPVAAGEKLAAGEIDVAFITGSWDSQSMQRLLNDERIALSSYPRADALVALYPYLNKVVVPRSTINFAKDEPPSDVVLVAAKTSLIVRKDVHPAIQYLLLNAAVEIHSHANIFHRSNEFPAPEAVEIPLSNEALRFYKSGLPMLHEYFPFWMSSLIGKLIILLIPILGVVYPLTRLLPRVYDWAMRSKIARLYGELRFLEDELASARVSGGDTRDMVARLDRLEEQANHLRIPATYASMLYMLRNHIDLVRAGLSRPADKPVKGLVARSH